MANGQVGTLLRHIRSLVVASHDNLLDQELLQRFVSRREEAAFAALVQRLGPLVLGVCRRVLHHEHDAEDAFQATFLVLARKAGSIRRQESLAGFLSRVAYHIALKAQARACKRQAQEREAAAMPQANPQVDVNCSDLRQVLDQELQRLPVHYRAPLVLCYLEGRTRDEAAQELGCSADTVKGRLERGRELLRKRLTQRGLSLSSVLLATALTRQASATAVPGTLAAATVEGALRFTAGQGAAEAVVDPVAALANGALRSLFLTRLKIGAILVLALSALAVGVSLFCPELAAEPAITVGRIGNPSHGEAAVPQPAPVLTAARDVYGDPLPAGALVRLGTVRLRHGDRIECLAFSPDNKILASAGVDKTIRLWDVVTGKEVRLIQAQGYPVGVTFAPDGKTVASGCTSGLVQMWEVSTGKELRQVGQHQGPVEAVAYSADGTLLATGGRDKTIRLWELATGKERSLVSQGEVYAVAFSPNGTHLASGGTDRAATLWELATGKQVAQFGTEGIAGAIAFSPDGKTLAAGCSDQAIHLWDLTTGKAHRQLRGRQAMVRGVAFTPDGKSLVSTGEEGESTVSVWDLATGKELQKLQGELNDCKALALSPDGKTVAAAGSTNLIRLWEVATGKELHRPQGHLASVTGFAFAPDGKTLASLASSDGVRLWDAASGKEVRRLGGKAEGGQSLAFAPDGKTVASACFAANVIRICDTATGKELRILPGSERDPVWAVTFSPDGKLLVSGGVAGLVQLWDATTGQKVRQLRQPAGCLATAFAFAPDSQTLAAGGDGSSIQVWSVTTGKELARFNSTSSISSLAFSPDGQTLATAESDGNLRLWDVARGKERLSCKPQNPALRCVAFSPDGRTMVSGSDDHSVVLWEAATGQELVRFVGHQGYVWSVAFSPDGRTVVSASYDTTGLVWDVTGRLKQGQLEAVELTPHELETLWTNLSSEDAPRAHRALWTLVAAPTQTLPFLQARLKMPAADARRIDRLLGELDDDQFEVREKASHELAALGRSAELSLRKALAGKPSAEVRLRVQALLDKLGETASLRHARVASVLEQIGSPKARRLLETLARDATEAELRQEAKAALQRLVKRGAS